MRERDKETREAEGARSGGPAHRIPALACDAHHHIYDPARFPYRPGDVRRQPPATVGDYQKLKERLGIGRSVIVQPSAYARDNRCTLEALRALGRECTRAVVVVDAAVSEEELAEMDRLGVVGVRFNLCSGGGPRDLRQIEALAGRIAPLGWSAEFFLPADRLVALEDFLRSLPCAVVIDHQGHLPAGEGLRHPAFAALCRLLAQGRTWVKLSGLYIDAAREDYGDAIAIGRELCRAAPRRCVWGSDWPHPIVYDRRLPLPDDARLLDALYAQAGSEEAARRILVDNAAELFRFP